MDVSSNCTNIALSGTEVEIHFTHPYKYIWVENLGTSPIKISREKGIASRDYGFIQRPPNSSGGMSVDNATIYIYGESGSVNVMGTDSAENPYELSAVSSGGGSSGGTTDYNDLNNRPQIEGRTLTGNKTFNDLGLIDMTELEVTDMIKRIKGEI